LSERRIAFSFIIQAIPLHLSLDLMPEMSPLDECKQVLCSEIQRDGGCCVVNRLLDYNCRIRLLLNALSIKLLAFLDRQPLLFKTDSSEAKLKVRLVEGWQEHVTLQPPTTAALAKTAANLEVCSVRAARQRFAKIQRRSGKPTASTTPTPVVWLLNKLKNDVHEVMRLSHKMPGIDPFSAEWFALMLVHFVAFLRSRSTIFKLVELPGLESCCSSSSSLGILLEAEADLVGDTITAVSTVPEPSRSMQKDAFFREQNPKAKVALICGFIGTDFHGSCYQGESTETMTIELAIKRALIKSGLAGRTCSKKAKGWSSCSRVDAGVHAEKWLLTVRVLRRAHTDLEIDEGAAEMSGDRIKYIKDQLNLHLPAAVRVITVAPVPDEFDPVAHCCSRVYKYRLPWELLLPPPPVTQVAPSLQESHSVAVRDAALQRLNTALGKFVTDSSSPPPLSPAHLSFHNFTQVGKLPWLKQRVQQIFKQQQKQQRKVSSCRTSGDYLPVWEAKQMRHWWCQYHQQPGLHLEKEVKKESRKATDEECVSEQRPQDHAYAHAQPAAGFDLPVVWTDADGAAYNAPSNADGAAGLDLDADATPLCWPQWVVEGTRKQVYACWAEEEEEGGEGIGKGHTHVVVTIRAPSFMYNQIRYMMGAGMGVASGAIPEWLVDLALFTGRWAGIGDHAVGSSSRLSAPVVLLPLAPAAGLALIDANFNFSLSSGAGFDSGSRPEVSASTGMEFSLSAPPAQASDSADIECSLASTMSTRTRLATSSAMRSADVLERVHESHRYMARVCGQGEVELMGFAFERSRTGIQDPNIPEQCTDH
jgi:tRNA pseudouridine(38-40) synthase